MHVKKSQLYDKDLMRIKKSQDSEFRKVKRTILICLVKHFYVSHDFFRLGLTYIYIFHYYATRVSLSHIYISHCMQPVLLFAPKSLAKSLGSDYMHDSRRDSVRDSFFLRRHRANGLAILFRVDNYRVSAFAKCQIENWNVWTEKWKVYQVTPGFSTTENIAYLYMWTRMHRYNILKVSTFSYTVSPEAFICSAQLHNIAVIRFIRV